MVGDSGELAEDPKTDRQLELAQAISSGVTTTCLGSAFGHDGFLAERRQLDSLLRQALG
jgi:hypothetical protein